MKTLLKFVAASLILVGATIAIAIPNPVEATSAGWCQPFAAGECFNSKGECEKSLDGIAECLRGLGPT
jgi:hypothetical protein